MGSIHPGIPQKLAGEIRARFGTNEFVETGTYLGDTTAWAAAVFGTVYTIEAYLPLHQGASARFSSTPNVEVLFGSSIELLPKLLPRLKGTTLFWLDAHWSGSGTAGENLECPLLDELRLILGHSTSHIVLIDDARLFLAPPPMPHEVSAWPTFENIIETIREIAPSAYVVVIEDIIAVVPSEQKVRFVALVREKQSSGQEPEETPIVETLRRRKLWQDGSPLKLHLGCGEQRFEGYVNIDFPTSQHSVMTVGPDLETDITTLNFPNESVDEIRLHHVFEHFNRVVALASLIRWHQWLRIGGRLVIETPDFAASAADFLAAASLGLKMRAIRHLEGDQAAEWGYHVGQWFPERFVETLKALGFSDIEVKQETSSHDPPLFNVIARATKIETASLDDQYRAACDLLRQFMVAAAEQPTFEVWARQLARALDFEEVPRPAITHPPPVEPPLEGASPAAQPAATQPTPPPLAAPNGLYRELRWAVAQLDRRFAGGLLSRLRRRLRDVPSAPDIPSNAVANKSAREAMLEAIERSLTVDVARAHDFNALEREAWVKAKAGSVAAGSRVLDVGAGTAPYRQYFSHCEYETHDFGDYQNYQDGAEGIYAPLTYVSDICKIPVPDQSFDVILCSEVLEHVPYPIDALAEMCRIVKPEGRLFLTAPLGSGLHQEPYHFYGGYTDHWYCKFLTEFGCEIVSIEPNHGFFAHLAQECARFSWTYDRHKDLHGDYGGELSHLMGNLLARYFYDLDQKVFMREFTVGFHVEARRVSSEPVRDRGPTSRFRKARRQRP